MLTEKEKIIVQEFGETEIEVEAMGGNMAWGVSPVRCKTKILTVKEAMRCWDGTCWFAENQYVTISFNEDYGHQLKMK